MPFTRTLPSPFADNIPGECLGINGLHLTTGVPINAHDDFSFGPAF